MKRTIISINEEKCIGCGLCISACEQGAIQLVDGKAKLISEDYCDGLGNCLPKCPVDAINLEEREAIAFDHEASLKRSAKANNKESYTSDRPSQLRQWPVQLKLVPSNAPYLDNSHLLIAADCTAFAYGNIHNDFMRNKATVIACPKLDNEDYSERLTAILENNNIKTLTVLKMEVPCCSGLAIATKNALINSKKMIPWSIVTISTEGDILED